MRLSMLPGKKAATTTIWQHDPRGYDRVAFVAFNKHIADEAGAKLIQMANGNGQLFEGSDEQKAIWSHATDPNNPHMVINAGAGTGKTWTMLALVSKLGAVDRCQVSTYHSLGLRALQSHFGFRAKVDGFNVYNILDDFDTSLLDSLGIGGISKGQWRSTKAVVSGLVGLAKNYLLLPDSSGVKERLLELAEHHGVDLVIPESTRSKWGREDGGKRVDPDIAEAAILQLTVGVLKVCLDSFRIGMDYDDMIYLPVALEIPLPQFDLLVVDELQDTNMAQQELAMRSCLSGKIIGVGDRAQSIYGFRGADIEAIQRVKDRLGATERGVVELPLMTTRRCPTSHVELANAIVPSLRALPDAPIGTIECLKSEVAVGMMRPGDLVLCRVNAPLISTAYKIVRRGIKARVCGRDLTKGLLAVIETVTQGQNLTVEKFLGAVEHHRLDELRRLTAGDKEGKRSMGRVVNMHDQMDTLRELCYQAKDVQEVKDRINTIFNDDNDRTGVVLGTVHRTKGLEGKRVFILNPELLPHPMATLPWEDDQEENLAYVAATRSKFEHGDPVGSGCLYFVDGEVPGVYGGVCSDDDDDVGMLRRSGGVR